jgi:branched-chain amino acid transport system substrate-binding protein
MGTKRWVVSLWVMPVVLLVMVLAFGAKASAADEISIGVIGPMKFVFGKHMGYGADITVDKINAAGGIQVEGKKYKVAVVKIDDNSFLSTPDAVSAMERLITVNKAKYIFGGFRTESVLAQQEVAADNKVLFVGAGSAADEQCLNVAKDYNRYKYWFRAGPIASTLQAPQYFAMVGPVIRELNKIGIAKPKVALLIDKAQWAEAVVTAAQTLFPQMGCEVVGTWRPSFTATTVTAELSAIKSAGAHIIFTAHAGPAGNVVSRQWGELQIPAALTGVNTEAVRETYWKASDGKCNYMMTAAGIAQDLDMTKNTRAFLAEFEKRYGEAPIYTATGTSDGITAWKEAVERANSFDVEKIVPAMEKTDTVGVTVMRLQFTPVGSKQPHDLAFGPQNSTAIGLQWQDGKLVCFWPDGKEIHPALIAAGQPTGWDKLRFKGSKDYVLPPRVVEYWKGKK